MKVKENWQRIHRCINKIRERINASVGTIDRNDFTLVNKNSSVEDNSNVDSNVLPNLENGNFKRRGNAESTVKSSVISKVSNVAGKPKSNGKLTLGAKSKPKTSNQNSDKNPVKPTKSKKASKKTTKR